MIFVDTSVWVDYFRGKRVIVETLHSCLDERKVCLAYPVYLELIKGAQKSEIPILVRVLSALPKFIPSEECWQRCESWIEVANARGSCFGILDLLIASLSVEHQSLVWSLDRDFSRMEKLGLITLFQG